MKSVCVVDGQGGGMGRSTIKMLREQFDEEISITALGTNAIATAQMLKAKANCGASGENAICRTVEKVDVIIGPIGIVISNAMMGEVTPKIAEAVSNSRATKLLIPLTQENIEIVGMPSIPLPHLVETLIREHLKNI